MNRLGFYLIELMNIFRYCGNELPRKGNIISTQYMLYLWFRSDNSSAHDGFELNWQSIDPGIDFLHSTSFMPHFVKVFLSFAA